MDVVTIVSLSLAAISIAMAIVALRRGQWRENIRDWSEPVLDFITRSTVRVYETRKLFWAKNIQRIIRECDELMVLDSYQGHKHSFWDELNRQVQQPERFHLIY